MTLRRDTIAFYSGVMVGVLGNLLVSCGIEMSKAMLEGAEMIVLGYWASSFIVSSALFFQLTKWAMGRLRTAQELLWPLDVVTVVFIFLGIFVMIFGLVR